MAKLVGKRYATALFNIATENQAVEEYNAEVAAMVTAFKETPDLVAVLDNSKITIEEKITLAEKIFENKVQAPIVGLLVLMIKKRRQGYILETLEAFLELVEQSTGIIRATVTSAVPLKAEQLKQIKANLEASTKGKIELETIIDTSIIAGLIIRVGDKVVDTSVQGELQALKKQLSKLRLA